VAHFAERYSLFVIICLGESIVAVGVAAGSRGTRPLSAALVVAVALGLLITVAMWWTYFDRAAGEAEERLRAHDDPVLAAADAYSYLHLVLVAGIIIFAVGLKDLARGSVTAPLAGPARLALTAGIALYLIGQAAVTLRLHGDQKPAKLVAAVALLILYAVAGGLPAWSVAAIAAALTAGLAGFETWSGHGSVSR
jgi:low temperature requirement protein LtrA